MAISNPSFVLLISFSVLLMVSPSISQTCKSQNSKFSSYLNCTDLPVLSATLHWTYTAANGSLSVAFTAPPPTPVGWVGWAINPTGTKMAGAQALVAGRRANGSISVQTFNLASYTEIIPGNLSFEVSHTAAEFSGGNITISAVVKLPATTGDSINHVWQAGPGFNSTNGWLLRHSFATENLAAFGKLNLGSATTTTTNTTTATNTISPSASPLAPSPSPGKSGVGSVTVSFGNLVLCALVSLLVIVSH